MERKLQYKLDKYEIETIVEYLDDYIKACIEAYEYDSLYTEADKLRKREALTNYLIEIFGYGEK